VPFAHVPLSWKLFWVKSYLIKQCREDVNKTFSILQTSGPHPGAQLDFYETIDRLLDKISNESDTLEPPYTMLPFDCERRLFI
jgi:hypothetical protein